MDYQTARDHALERDRVCQSCGAGDGLHAHHIVPRNEGGPDTPENLVILCKYCHPKYEGTDKVPSYAGGGNTVSEVSEWVVADQVHRIVVDELMSELGPFQMVLQDTGVCSNCFQRPTGIPTLLSRLEAATHETMTGSPFKEVQTDHDVCSNCFRRTHGRYERNYRLETYHDDEEGEWSVRPVDVSPLILEINGEEVELGGYSDHVFRNPEETTKIPEKGAIRGLRTICKCGFRYKPGDDEWRNRPLDKRTFFEYADHLAKRLRENGVEFDEDAFYEILDQLKSDPDEQFADDRIFEKACSHASAVTVKPQQVST